MNETCKITERVNPRGLTPFCISVKIISLVVAGLVANCNCDGKSKLEKSSNKNGSGEPKSIVWLRGLKAGITRNEIESNPSFDRFIRIDYRSPLSTEEIVAKDGGSILAIFRSDRYRFDGLDSLRAIDADGDRHIPDE